MFALAAGMAQAQPTTETITGSTSFTVITINPCNGEEYVLEGVFHFVLHMTDDENTSVVISEFQGRGSGTAPLTGNQYQMNEAHIYEQTNHSESTDHGAGFEITAAGHGNIIGEGPVPDYLHHFVTHITVTPDSRVVSEVLWVDTECKG